MKRGIKRGKIKSNSLLLTGIIFIILIIFSLFFSSLISKTYIKSADSASYSKITGFAMADGSKVSRDFNQSTVIIGGYVNVSIIVTLTQNPLQNHSYYLIDEKVPNGFTIISASGGANLSESGHLKWVVIQNAASINYSYIVRAPLSPTFDNFNGTYFIEGMSNSSEIEGAKNVIVVTCIPSTEVCDGLDNDCNGVIDNINRLCNVNHTGICAVGSEICTLGVWNDCPAPQTEICGNNIDENCDGSDTQCLPCVLTSATWNQTTANEGSKVNLFVQGTNCGGKIINFSVLEDDIAFDNPANINPPIASFIGSLATSNWTAEWECDGQTFFGCTGGNPEYYFITTLVSNSSVSINSLNYAGGILTTISVCRDNDNDGDSYYGVLGCGTPQDCNDNNANINPGATEICNNGPDDDCDGNMDCFDTDCLSNPICFTTYYCDSDNDTYFSSTISEICNTFNCMPAGCQISPGSDCDDNNNLTYPGAIEICDGLDNDCSSGTLDGSGQTPPNNSNQSGVCLNSKKSCTGGSWNDDYTGVSQYENPETTKCDDLDNDCDNQIDEVFSNDTCSFVCLKSGFNWTGNLGSLNCCGNNVNEDSPYQTTESNCNDGRDNDCDGQIDLVDTNCYACTPLTKQNCLKQEGVCFGSQETCNALGQWLGCDYSIIPDYDGFVEIRCDGKDNNCNGQIDENVKTTYYGDEDRDNYGNATNTTLACSKPAGYMSNSNDCNDNNNLIYPGANELCNGIDDNCANEITDEIGVCSAVIYYCDLDNDNYVSSTISEICNTFNCMPAGCQILPGSDCDDNNPNLNQKISCNYDGSSCGITNYSLCVLSCPIPPRENCLDITDNDCDSLIDGNDPECSGDEDNDGVIDDLDCNDNNNLIGVCVSCSVCNITTIGIGNGACIPGIPKPKMYKYENSITTDLTNKNLLNNISNFSIGIPNISKVDFIDDVRLFRNVSGTCEILDFDAYINISAGKVDIKSENLPELNKSAIITMYKINLIGPYIIIDGEKCTECSIISYSNNTLMFRVSHFSEYSVAGMSSITGKVVYEVRGCGDGICDSVSGETCGTTNNAPECNADCSTCPAPPPSGGGGGTPSSGGGGGTPPTSKNFNLSTEELSIKLTQGESKSLSFSVTNMIDSSNFEVSSNLNEITFPESTFTLIKDESKTVNITINVDASKPYGIYVGKIYVKSGSITEEILISIEVVSADSLFDVVLTIPIKYMYILPGKKLISDVTLTRLAGLTGSNDVILTYIIKNEFGDIIFSENEQKTITETLTSISKEILIPKEEEYGKHVFYVQLDYTGKIASASQWFNVGTKSKLVGIIFWIITIVVIIAIAAVVYVIYLRKRAENYEIIKKGF